MTDVQGSTVSAGAREALVEAQEAAAATRHGWRRHTICCPKAAAGRLQHATAELPPSSPPRLPCSAAPPLLGVSCLDSGAGRHTGAAGLLQLQPGHARHAAIVHRCRKAAAVAEQQVDVGSAGSALLRQPAAHGRALLVREALQRADGSAGCSGCGWAGVEGVWVGRGKQRA